MDIAPYCNEDLLLIENDSHLPEGVDTIINPEAMSSPGVEDLNFARSMRALLSNGKKLSNEQQTKPTMLFVVEEGEEKKEELRPEEPLLSPHLFRHFNRNKQFKQQLLA